MAASVKFQWYLAKYAKFVYNEDVEDLIHEENAAETFDVPCKGKWKVYTGSNKDLMLSYLKSDHLLITHNDIILESFSLINSRNWLKGVAKKDSLLILNKLKDGNNRRFRIQFIENGAEYSETRSQCTELLKKHFPICDYDIQSETLNKLGETANINQMVFDKLKFRKAYAVEVLTENLKEIIMLCLTDTTFPSYVAEVNEILKNIDKELM